MHSHTCIVIPGSLSKHTHLPVPASNACSVLRTYMTISVTLQMPMVASHRHVPTCLTHSLCHPYRVRPLCQSRHWATLRWLPPTAAAVLSASPPLEATPQAFTLTGQERQRTSPHASLAHSESPTLLVMFWRRGGRTLERISGGCCIVRARNGHANQTSWPARMQLV